MRHQYAAPGTYTVTVTATDAAGEQATASRVVEVAATPVVPVPVPVVPVTPAADTKAPLLTDVEVLPKRVRRGRAATLRFSTDEPALVTVTVTRRVSGVRRGGRCVASRAKTRAKRCTRAVTVRTVSAPFAKGYGTLKLSTKKLPLGKLRVYLTATDAAGNNSAPVSRRLTVKRRCPAIGGRRRSQPGRHAQEELS